jgi:hypothetical protein
VGRRNDDQFVARWPARREFVRRDTSSTGLANLQPHAELIEPSADLDR